jgi:hypothetical protein
MSVPPTFGLTRAAAKSERETMSIGVFILALDRGGKPVPRIPVALIAEIFSSRIAERSATDGQTLWSVRYPANPSSIGGVPVICGFELGFEDENGMTASVSIDVWYVDDEVSAQLFRLLRETGSVLIGEGQRPAVASQDAAVALPDELTQTFGPAFLLRDPKDLFAIPDAEREPRPPQPAAREAFIAHARSLQAQMQGRQRFHNLAKALKARAQAGATRGSSRSEEILAALSRIIAATSPLDSPDWMTRTEKALAALTPAAASVAVCQPDVLAHPHGVLAAEFAGLRAEADAITRIAAARPWRPRQVLELGSSELGALLSRVAMHLSWRLGADERGLADDLYLQIPGDRMFEVEAIERPPVDVGSLHDDVIELRKLLADPDRPVTPVDVERLGHLMLALAARM